MSAWPILSVGMAFYIFTNRVSKEHNKFVRVLPNGTDPFVSAITFECELLIFDLDFLLAYGL